MAPSKLRVVVAVSAAALAAAPAAADAATVTGKGNGKHVFKAGAGEKNKVSLYRDRKGRLLFRDRGVSKLKARGRCKRVGKRKVRCPASRGPVTVKLRNRNDRLDATARTRVRAYGGGGRDRVKGGPLADFLSGGGGNDNLSGRGGKDRIKGGGGRDFIAGGRGDDRLYGNGQRDHIQGRSGDDVILGGGGRDLLKGGRGDDRIRGGPGRDKVIDDAYLKDFVGIDSQDTFQAAFNNDMNAMTANLSAQAATGIKIHRQVFTWEQIEKSRGRYDFTIHDRYMAKMAAHGMKVLAVLFDAPPFHTRKKDKPGQFSPPKNGKSLGKFARALINRYGLKGSFWKHPAVKRFRKRSAITSWQIWNEPNLRQYWGGKPNARQYVKMLRQARKQMRKARGGKRAEIVTAGVPESKIKGAIPLRRYVPAMYKAGLKKVSDTFGFNAYANNTKDLKRKIKRVRRWMDRAGDRKAPIWITEIGWASAGRKHRLRKGLRGQAREVRKAIALMAKQRKKRKLRGFVYYNWRDSEPYREGISADTWGFHAGLLRINGEFKPAHRAFRTAVSKLR